MDKFLKSLLKKYNPREKELYLKAKFVFITTVCVIVTLLIILVYTSYLGGIDNKVIFAESAGFIIMLLALWMLIKGSYEIAIHILLITGFITIWSVLFIKGVTIITQLDTIVFVVGLLAAMPLLFFKTRKPMIVYFVINMLMFIIYNYHLLEFAELNKIERMDYFLDNAVVMVFVFTVSFILFAIYQEALNSLKTVRRELE